MPRWHPLESIINKSEAVKKAKKEKGDNMTAKEKKELSAEEKESKSKRKEIQQKLIKFATRIPVFMYLTDFREYTLYDVIHQLEPELFRKVTGLTLPDFDLLVSLGVFNRELMNDAVYKFKRYEDASLVYTGINTHEGENVGGFDTVISEETFMNQIPLVDLSSSSSLSDVSHDSIDDTEESSQEGEEAEPWLSYKVGDSVTHKSFGDGVISALEGKYIWIKFATNEKKFLFPQCFEKGFFSV